jgi:hypothetical protein
MMLNGLVAAAETINPATQYVVFSQSMPACSKTSKRRCSPPYSQF